LFWNSCPSWPPVVRPLTLWGQIAHKLHIARGTKHKRERTHRILKWANIYKEIHIGLLDSRVFRILQTIPPQKTKNVCLEARLDVFFLLVTEYILSDRY